MFCCGVVCAEFSDHYLIELTKNDTYEPVGSGADHFSSSVVDLFSLLYPLWYVHHYFSFVVTLPSI